MSADASQQFAQFAHRDSASLAALTTIHQFYAMGSDCAVHLRGHIGGSRDIRNCGRDAAGAERSQVSGPSSQGDKRQYRIDDKNRRCLSELR
jgi:hypothetical protein